MSFASKVKNGGWGGVFLWVYILAILLVLDIDIESQRFLVLSLAAIPSLVVMFLVEQFIDFLNDWWAGGNLKRSASVASQVTGEEHPYEALNSDAQNRVDKFDDKAYGKQVTILTGLIIALSSPFTGYLAFGPPGILAGVIFASIVLWILVYRSVLELKDLASGIAEVYQHKHEN